jgi:hypothetical protein
MHLRKSPSLAMLFKLRNILETNNGDYPSLEIDNTASHSDPRLAHQVAKQAVARRSDGVQGQLFQKRMAGDSHVPGATVTGAVCARSPRESLRVNSMVVPIQNISEMHI